MKKVMENIFEHPIGTAILITAVTRCAIRVIRAVKGIEPELTPAATINIMKKAEE